MMRRALSAFLSICLMFAVPTVVPAAAQTTARYYSKAEISDLAGQIIEWKKAACGLSSSQSLLDEGLSGAAGSYNADWYAIGMKRLGSDESDAVYTAKLHDAVIANIAAAASPSFKVTDLHRNILALLVTGGDPISFDTPGGSINLLNDYVYNRGLTASLGKQGITGWMWALVALDSMQYGIPDGSDSTRDEIIVEILKQQRATNGFSLSGGQSDPDITAMVITVLSPYYNSEKEYTYIKTGGTASVTRSVREVLDEALTVLSAMQLASGDYQTSWGGTVSRNAETPAQVILALCSLGIDPQTDARFIKNGKTLLDGILLYRTADGGFSHTLPATAGNSIASEQVLLSMTALLRHMNGMRRLYDFRPEQSSSVKTSISGISGRIASITAATPLSGLQSILADYQTIADGEKMYVANYFILADALVSASTTSSGSKGSVSASGSGPAPTQQGSGSSSQEESRSGESSIDGAASGSSSGADSSTGNTHSDSSDGPGGSSRTLTTILAVAAILTIAGLTAWSGSRKRRRKHVSEEPSSEEKTDGGKE